MKPAEIATGIMLPRIVANPTVVIATDHFHLKLRHSTYRLHVVEPMLHTKQCESSLNNLKAVFDP